MAVKRTARKIKTKSQEFAESIINTVREPLIVLDQDLRVVSASRSFYEIFKVNPKETVGQLIYDLGNKQWDIPKLRELLETILPEKTTFDDYEVEHDFTTIGKRIMLLNARQIQRAWGKERIILLAIQDITERRRLQVSMQESEERYRRAFETSRDGLLLVHKIGGDILNSNESAQKLLGYSKEKFLKKKLWETGVVKDYKDFQETSVRLERDSVIYYTDTSVKTAKGLSITADVFLVDRAKVFQCNIRDITERKLAEAILKRDKISFEKMVEERTMELLNAQKEMEKGRRLLAIGTLAATIAHELRNPLATIRMAVHNIRKKMSDTRIEQHLANIEAVIEESSQIINNLLFYSRIRMPERKNINLYDILSECILIAKQQFKKQDVSVIMEIGGLKGFSFEADPMQMKEVFSNILNNAYDAIADSKGTITIGAKIHDNECLEVYFRDTGEGINPADIEKVTEPFFTTKSRGTGLGLTVCYQIVTLYEGQLNIETKRNKGTTLTMLLPIKNKNVKKNTDS